MDSRSYSAISPPVDRVWQSILIEFHSSTCDHRSLSSILFLVKSPSDLAILIISPICHLIDSDSRPVLLWVMFSDVLESVFEDSMSEFVFFFGCVVLSKFGYEFLKLFFVILKSSIILKSFIAWN